MISELLFSSVLLNFKSFWVNFSLELIIFVLLDLFLSIRATVDLVDKDVPLNFSKSFLELENVDTSLMILFLGVELN